MTSTRLTLLLGAVLLGVVAATVIRLARGGGRDERPTVAGAIDDLATTGTPSGTGSAPSARRRDLRPPVWRMPVVAGDGGVDADVIASIDPTAKNYDPVVIARTMNLSPTDLLRREPRDAAFADRREPDLRDRVLERLRKRLPYDVKVDAVCRTSSCELTVRTAHQDDDLGQAVEALDLNGLTESAELSASRDPDGAGARMSVVLLYSADQRDHDEYERQLRQHAAHDEATRP